MILQKIKAYSNTILTLLDQGVVSGGNFLLGVVLARLLGIEGYGVYALLWMIVLFGKSIHQAFITRPMLSLAPKKEAAEAKSYLTTLHVLTLLFTLFLLLFIRIFLFFGKYFDIQLPDNQLFWIVPTVVGLHLLYDFYRSTAFVRQSIKFAFFLDSALFIFQLIAVGVIYWYDLMSVTHVLLGVAVAHGLACLIGFAQTPALHWNWVELQLTALRHFDLSKWLVGTAILQWFSGNFFLIAAAWLMSEAAVGAVRIVQNVMGLVHVLFLAMENVVPVKAALHFKEGGTKQLRQYLWYITQRAGGLVGGLLLLLAVFRNAVIEFLYGVEYLPYSYLVIGFCLTYVLIFIGHPLRFALMTLEITKPIFVAYVLGAAFSLILAYPLVGRLGLVGLLIGYFVTQGLSQLVYLFYLKRVMSNP